MSRRRFGGKAPVHLVFASWGLSAVASWGAPSQSVMNFGQSALDQRVERSGLVARFLHLGKFKKCGFAARDRFNGRTVFHDFRVLVDGQRHIVRWVETNVLGLESESQPVPVENPVDDRVSLPVELILGDRVGSKSPRQRPTRNASWLSAPSWPVRSLKSSPTSVATPTVSPW